MSPDIVTVVPCFGRSRETRLCLESLLAGGGSGGRIIVVENQTSENAENLSRDFPSVTFLRNEANEGFTGAVNRGIREGRAFDPDLYFILNNDAVVEPGTVPALTDALARHPDAALAAPKIFQDPEKKTLWAAGGEVMFWKFMGRNRGQGEPDRGQYDREEYLDFLSGCALMARPEALEELGGLDEDFFTYAEDLDLSLRAGAAGWKLLYAPRARVTHAASSTAGGQYEPFQSFYRWRNRFLLASKHGGAVHRFLFFVLFAPVLMARDLGTYVLKGKARSIPFLFKGLRAQEPLRAPRHSRLRSGYLLSNPVLIALTRAADVLGGILFFFIPKRAFPADVRRILIAKTDHLGDVLMSLHALPALRRAFPLAEIHFLCGSWAAKLVEKNPLVSRVIVWDDPRLSREAGLAKRILGFFENFGKTLKELRRVRYDIAADLRAYYPNFIPFMPLVRSRFRLGYATGGFGFLLDKAAPWKEGVHETEHMLGLFRPFIPDLKREPLDLSYLIEDAPGRARPFAVLHPFCEKSFLKDQKHWKEEEWRKVIQGLEKNGLEVVCSGDSHDRPLIEELIRGTGAVNAAGRLSIGALAGLIARARFTVCVDTFFAHLSGALGAETLELFNDVEPVEQWKAYGPRVRTFPIDCKAEDILE
ncbi:MAG: hypothetical protein A3A86_02140 [Elusimicrobia bacterium RIFCSPLOWO2_01_FULL_60_11]|nr:MAG: hypothetical protein A3A86_02140 [Elusimicrobia bacterium RIFCSPLOWO2_01_FULL_60_11]